MSTRVADADSLRPLQHFHQVQGFPEEGGRDRRPLDCNRHYARVVDGELVRGVDENKDQTYFLWGIDRAVLSRLLLPVGGLDKAQTRARATRWPGSDRGEAGKPEICFAPDGDYARILEQRLPEDAPALSRGR